MLADMCVKKNCGLSGKKQKTTSCALRKVVFISVPVGANGWNVDL